MPTQRVSELFKALPFAHKLIGVGSLVLVVSTFLPWYQDLDSFRTGDTFFGISGPLYLVGFSLLALGALNIFVLITEYNSAKAGSSSERKLSFLPLKSSSFFLGSGLFVFYMLMVVSSVYFHQKFGINITWKQSQFGMFSAFIAASLMTIGGYLAGRDRKTLLEDFEHDTAGSLNMGADQVKARGGLMQMPRQEKPKESLRALNESESENEENQVDELEGVSEMRSDVERSAAERDNAASETLKKKPQSFRIDL